MALAKVVEDRIRHQFYDIVNPTNVFWAQKALDNMDTHLRGVSGGVTWVTKAGKLVDEPIADAQALWREIAGERLRQLSGASKAVAAVRSLRGRMAERLRLDDQPLNHRVLFRKMSIAEWRALFKEWKPSDVDDDKFMPERKNYDADGKEIIRFENIYKYTDTDNFRYWLSTSLLKCKKFDNANATTSTDVVVRFKFAESAKSRFGDREMLPHKQKGVQTKRPDVVAWHREEFFEEEPNIDDTAVMKARLALPTAGGHNIKRHYCLGFTSQQLKWLKDNCQSAQPMI